MSENVDITTLVLKVDATQPEGAAGSLGKLEKQAQATGAAVDDLAKKSENLSKAAKQAATDSATAGAAIDQQAVALGRSRSLMDDTTNSGLGMSKMQAENARQAMAAQAAYEAYRKTLAFQQAEMNKTKDILKQSMVNTEAASAAELKLDAAVTRSLSGIDKAYAAKVAMTKSEDLLRQALEKGVITQATYDAAITALVAKYGPMISGAEESAGALAAIGLTGSKATRSMMALGDELAAGRHRQAAGTLSRIAGMIGEVNAAALGAIAGVLALVGVFGYMIVSTEHANEAIGNLQARFKTGGRLSPDPDELGKFISMLERIPGTTRDMAVKALGDFATLKTGSEDLFAGLVLLIPAVARGMGVDVSKAAETMAQAFNDPATNARKLDEELNFLTARQLEQIEAASRAGDQARAQGILFDALKSKMQGMESEGLTPLETAWRNFKNTLLGMPDKPSPFFTWFNEQLAKAIERLTLLAQVANDPKKFMKDLAMLPLYNAATLPGGEGAQRIIQQVNKPAFNPLTAPAIAGSQQFYGPDGKPLSAEMAAEIALGDRNAASIAAQAKATDDFVKARLKATESYQSNIEKARELGDVAKGLHDALNKLGARTKDNAQEWDTLQGRLAEVDKRMKDLTDNKSAVKYWEDIDRIMENAKAHAEGLTPEFVKLNEAFGIAVASGQTGRAAQIMEVIQAMVASQPVIKDSDAAMERAQQAVNKLVEEWNKAPDAIEKENEKLLEQTMQMEMGKQAVIDYQIAMLQAQRIKLGDQIDPQFEAALLRQIELLKQRKTILAAQDANKAEQDRIKLFRQQIDELRQMTRQAGSDMADAFGPVGDAIGKVGDALVDFADRQEQIAREGSQRFFEAWKAGDIDKMFEAIKETQDRAMESTIKGFGDMASAAKGFFKEHSKGFQAMEAVERTFRAVEMALAIESFTTKIAQMLGLTTVKATTTATNMALDQAETTQSIANSTTKTGFSVIAGVAKAFEQMGVYGFIGAAAIIAFMAALGFKGSGGGGGAPNLAEDRQKTQGTGTVLGDPTAKSESIAHALDILKNNSSDDLLYTSQMLVSLRSIDSNMKGLASLAARIGLTGTGVQLPGGGGGNTFSLADSGIVLGTFTGQGDQSQDISHYAGQSVSDLINNPAASRYNDIARTHSGAFGSSYTAVNRDLSPLEAAFARQLSQATINLRDTLAEAVNILTGGKYGVDQIKQLINSLHIDPHEISFKDLKGDEIQAAIQSVFSAIGDDMATGVLSMMSDANLDVLQQFQHVGEGAFETVVRVASGVERATAVLNNWGIKIIDWRDIVDKQGDVTTELIRQSVVAAETTNGVVSGFGKIIDNFNGTADEMIQLYEKLSDLRNNMHMAGIDTGLLSQELITAAGGLSKLQDGVSRYFEKFFTDSERAGAMTSFVSAQFRSLGIEMPTTRAGLRQLIEHLSAIGDTDMLGRVLALVPAWDDAASAAQDAADKARDSWLDFQDVVDKFLGRDGGDQRRLGALISSFQSQNSAYAGMSQTELLQTLAHMDQATFDKFDDSTKQLIIAILKLAGDIQDNTKAQSAGTFGPTDVYSIRDQLLQAFDQKYNPLISGQSGEASQFGLRSKLLGDQIQSWQEKMQEIFNSPGTFTGGAFTPGPTYYALQAAIENAQGQLGGLAKDLARVTILEAQYGQSIGDQIFDLEKWYAQQQALLAGNNDALAALEQQYQDKRNQILQNGTQGGLDSLKDQLKQWRQSLVLSDQSPLTPDQRLVSALQQYKDTYAAASGGDQTALQNYQQVAQALLQEELSYYGRASMQYQAIFQQILKDSGGLAGVDPSQDPILNATKGVQSAVETQTDELKAKINELTNQVLGLQIVMKTVGTQIVDATASSTERLIDAGAAAK